MAVRWKGLNTSRLLPRLNEEKINEVSASAGIRDLPEHGVEGVSCWYGEIHLGVADEENDSVIPADEYPLLLLAHTSACPLPSAYGNLHKWTVGLDSCH